MRLSIITVSLLTSCSLAEKSQITILPDNIFIQCDSANRTILYFNQDYGLINNKVILDEKHTTQVYIDYPTIFEHNGIAYLIYPKEKLKVELDSFNNIVFKEANLQRNNELLFLKQLNYIIYPSITPHINNYSNTSSIKKILSDKNKFDSIQQKYYDTLPILFKKLFLQYPVSNRFKKIANEYATGIGLFNYYSFYTNTLNKYNLYKKENIELLPTLSKIRNISQLTYSESSIIYITSIAEGITNKSLSKIRSLPDFLFCFDTLSHYLSGISRDFILTKLMFKANEERIIIPEKYKQKYLKLCKTKQYKKLVQTQYNNQYVNTNKQIVIQENALQNINDKHLINIDSLINQYHGQILLLDFWASWCEPCIIEMPFFVQLRNQLKNRRVTFLSVSLDKNMVEWKSGILNNKIEAKNSYRFIDFQIAPFIKYYKIEEIPRYMLIGKDGKIISSDAPRPSDPKLKELIEKNL